MFDFVLEYFRKWFVAFLWIVLIGFIIVGIFAGWNTGQIIAIGMGIAPIIGNIIGVIIGCGLGFLVGAFFIIIGGGLIATFLNINEKINNISDELSKITKSKIENNKALNEKNNQ